MSRTDKDAPGWVRTMNAPHAVTHHVYGCVLHPYRSTSVAERACDIDTRDGRCYRWDRDHVYRYYSRPGQAEIHSRYFGPERAHVRDALRAAARDYAAYGDTDLEPLTRQNRRSTWSGDYWD